MFIHSTNDSTDMLTRVSGVRAIAIIRQMLDANLFFVADGVTA